MSLLGSLASVFKKDPYKMAPGLMRKANPETNRKIQHFLLRDQHWPEQRNPDPNILNTTVWNLNFSNPIGVAAGYDKDSSIIDEMIRIGYGFGEIGTLTLEPEYSPRRVVSLPEDNAIINQSVGFNNSGAKDMGPKLMARRGRRGVVGTSIGESVYAQDAIEEYQKALRATAPYSDYVVISLSSVNLQNLMEFQLRDPLEKLLRTARHAVSTAAPINTPPLLLKVAADLNDDGKQVTAELALKHNIDGLIVSGETKKRFKTMKSPENLIKTKGGLAGRPVFDNTTYLVKEMYYHTQAQIPIIACGGVASGQEAYLKIRAGASLVQLYSGIILNGPMIVREIKNELAMLLRQDGFASVTDAVGADMRAE